MKAFWFCEQCKTTGAVSYEEHAGIYEVYSAIQSAHMRARLECRADVRVLNLTYILTPHVPDWAVEPLAKVLQS